MACQADRNEQKFQPVTTVPIHTQCTRSHGGPGSSTIDFDIMRETSDKIQACLLSVKITTDCEQHLLPHFEIEPTSFGQSNLLIGFRLRNFQSGIRCEGSAGERTESNRAITKSAGEPQPSTEGMTAGSAIGQARAETDEDAAQNADEPTLRIARAESAHPHIGERTAELNRLLT